MTDMYNVRKIVIITSIFIILALTISVTHSDELVKKQLAVRLNENQLEYKTQFVILTTKEGLPSAKGQGYAQLLNYLQTIYSENPSDFRLLLDKSTYHCSYLTGLGTLENPFLLKGMFKCKCDEGDRNSAFDFVLESKDNTTVVFIKLPSCSNIDLNSIFKH